MSLKNRWMVLVAGLAITSSCALAQNAKKIEEQPAETKSEESESQSGVVVQSAGKLPSLPTHLPYPKLAQRGEDGRIVRLRVLPDIVALRANPTVGPGSVDEIMPVLYARRARFERMVIDNLDLYWKVTDGRLKNLNLGNIEEMARTSDMIKPLVGPSTLSQELLNRGILSRTQGGMNVHIINEYKRAITNEIQYNDEDPMSGMMRFVLEDSIHEAYEAYSAMLAESMPKISEIVSKAGIDSPAVRALVALEQDLSEDENARRKGLIAFNDAFRQLSYDEGTSILNTMKSLRENPDISPMITRIEVMRPGKVDMTEQMGGKVKLSRPEPTRAQKRKMQQQNKDGDTEESQEPGTDG